jgi:hypothetical protein
MRPLIIRPHARLIVRAVRALSRVPGGHARPRRARRHCNCPPCQRSPPVAREMISRSRDQRVIRPMRPLIIRPHARLIVCAVRALSRVPGGHARPRRARRHCNCPPCQRSPPVAWEMISRSRGQRIIRPMRPLIIRPHGRLIVRAVRSLSRVPSGHARPRRVCRRCHCPPCQRSPPVAWEMISRSRGQSTLRPMRPPMRPLIIRPHVRLIVRAVRALSRVPRGHARPRRARRQCHCPPCQCLAPVAREMISRSRGQCVIRPLEHCTA